MSDIMKFFTVAALLYFVTPTFSQDSHPMWYDSLYDQRDASIDSVACTGGQYGLTAQGFNTLGDLPTFPYVGGAPQVQGFASPNCGTCWQISYENANGNNVVFSFAVISTGMNNTDGFTLSMQALYDLTDGDAMMIDWLTVNVIEEIPTMCSLKF